MAALTSPAASSKESAVTTARGFGTGADTLPLHPNMHFKVNRLRMWGKKLRISDSFVA
jgi:hypothetical protein